MDTDPIELTRERAAGMTVNDRLYVSGLSDEFYAAAEKQDSDELRRILETVYLDDQNIEAILLQLLEKE